MEGREDGRTGSSPAAAAASTGFFGSGVALPASPLRGLRSRAESDFLVGGGERDLRSNRDRRGSGSVWSNRDRFVVRRSESSMVQGIV